MERVWGSGSNADIDGAAWATGIEKASANANNTPMKTTVKNLRFARILSFGIALDVKFDM